MKLKSSFTFLIAILMLSGFSYSQTEGDVIINEIGNNGGKKKLYTGGDYVELLVVQDGGVKLAGWFLTDLSGPGGTPKETEGYIKFSDQEGSIFNEVIPQGTYVLVCLGSSDEFYGDSRIKEDVSLSDGNNRIVVFAYDSKKHIEAVEGTIVLTGRDGIALTSAWNKKSAVDVVAWGGKMNWTGCDMTELPEEYLDNGSIIYFKPATGNFTNNTNVADWVTTTKYKDATPGAKNKDVDDSVFKK